jgi:hypothetical protein
MLGVLLLASGCGVVGGADGASAAATSSHDAASGSGRSPKSLLVAYEHQVVSGTRTVYVEAAGGSDRDDGDSRRTAYATIQHAVDVARPGDRILVGAGNYGYLSVYGYRGDATHWLSVQSVSTGVRPVIDVAGDSGDDGVDIQESSFVGLYGFQIEGLQTSPSPNPSGVGVFRDSDHVFIWNNDIHDFPGGGVNDFYSPATTFDGTALPAGGWDAVDVSFNTIHDTSRYNPTNTSGISFYGAVATTTDTLGGFGYRAVGNYIYDVICLVDSSSGAGTYPYVTDGNGISVDSLSVPYVAGLAPYTKTGLIEGNVIAGNGGRAVHVFNSIDVDGFFNTAVDDLLTDSPTIDGGAELDSNVPDGNVHFYGNVIVPRPATNATDAVSTYADNVIAGGVGPVPTGNIDHRTVGPAYLLGDPTPTTVTSGRPMRFFVPRRKDRVPFEVGMTGYQALDTGRVRTAGAVPAGALGND